MTIYESNGPSLPHVPDDKSCAQFIFDTPLPTPPDRANAGEHPCHIDEISGRKVYKKELRTRIDNLAKALQKDFGVGNGDIVCIYSRNHIDYPVCVWAVHYLGGIVAPVNSTLTKDELVYHLDILRPKLLFAHAESLPVAEPAAATIGIASSRLIILDGAGSHPSFDALISRGKQISSYKEYTFKPGEAKEKIAFLCFSSGTTGKPKAVAISHYNVICNVIQVATFQRVFDASIPWEDRRMRPGDVAIGVLPMFHIYGLVSMMHIYLYTRMTLIVCPNFDFARFLQSIERYRVTHLMLVPPQAVLLCKHPLAKKADLSAIRWVVLSAAPVSAELTSQFLAVLPPSVQLGQGYGLTETCSAISMWPLDQRVGTHGSAGQLVSGTIAKVVKDDGSLAKPGEPGELLVKGDQVALGYYKNEKATKEMFVDGWLLTGDHVIIQPNGDIFVLDRIKEIIKVKALQVAPAELEGHLLDHPSVADAGVIGVPDQYSGEVPFAFVVLKPQLTERVKKDKKLEEEVRLDIFQHVAKAKSKHKHLHGGIMFIDAIPKNPSGKILRRIMREQVPQERLKSKL